MGLLERLQLHNRLSKGFRVPPLDPVEPAPLSETSPLANCSHRKVRYESERKQQLGRLSGFVPRRLTQVCLQTLVVTLLGCICK